jgi:hypothetical protein
MTGLVTPGCMKPDSVTCAGGLVCPAGSDCDDVNHTCMNSPERTPCAGKASGAECTALDGAPGACSGGVCETFFCGDGKVTDSEACDGAPPPGKTCLDFGFERGVLGCSDSCKPVLTGCGYLGWQVMWSSESSPSLTAIWGSGPNDVFAVGGGSVVHWDGHGWSRYSTGGEWLNGVWGSGLTDVVAVGTDSGGYHGTVLQWDGRAWSQLVPSGIDLGYVDLLGVWGSGPDDVWVVGSGGTILHRTRSEWRSVPSGTTATLRAVWGASADDVYAVGDAGTIVHWDGDRWTATTTGAPDLPRLSSVWGASGNDLYTVGSDGRGGLLLHGDGHAWTVIPTGPTAELRSVWGSGQDDIFVVGGGSDGRVVLHWDGDAWHRTLTPEEAAPLSAVWGSGPSDVFAVAGNEISHWPDTTESTTRDENGSFADVRGGEGFDDVFAVDGNRVLHWDGQTWTGESGPFSAAWRIWPASPTDLFVIADGDAVFRKNDANWTDTGEYPRKPLQAIWGAAADDLFVAGDEGTIDHWNGSVWESMSSGTTADLKGLWGSGPRDVFAVGSDGTVVRWDGAIWKIVRAKAGQLLTDVWGSGPDDVFVAGPGLIHWDGTGWKDVPQAGVPVVPGWSAVGGSGPDDVFFCDGFGLTHSYLGAWEALPLVPSCSRLYVTRRQVFAIDGYSATVIDRHSVTCTAPELFCNDGWDDDCDGLVDGADPDCKGQVGNQCANLQDDDGDGTIDCADPDCANFPACRMP